MGEPFFIKTPTLLPENLSKNLYKIDSPDDGSCYFHSVLNAFAVDYREKENKKKVAMDFRKYISTYLESKDEKGMKIYDTLSGGLLPEYAKNSEIEEYTLGGMKKNLESGFSVGYEFHQIVSDLVDKDIYVLQIIKNQLGVYVFDDDFDNSVLYKNRDSMIILSENNHYNLVSRLDKDCHFQTLFRNDDVIISKLGEELKNLKKKKNKTP